MFKVKNEASRAVLYIYGTIGEDFWDEEDSNRAKAFAKTLDELNPKPLDIRIDSAGGDVYEGFAIASAIQRYEGETHVYIDGMAASAASYISAKTPPFMILHGTEDQTVDIAQSRSFYEKLTAAGVRAEYLELQGASHGDDAFYQPAVEQKILDFLASV